MRIAREEIFGPVLTAIPFKDEAEALELANDTKYGLTGYLWTSDVTRAFRFSDRLEARSEEHTSELQPLMRISYAVFRLKKQTNQLKHKRPLDTTRPSGH